MTSLPSLPARAGGPAVPTAASSFIREPAAMHRDAYPVQWTGSQVPLDAAIRRLFHAGLSLQAAMDAAHGTGRQYIMEAQRCVDEAIRDIRDHAFAEVPSSSRPPGRAR